MKTSLILRLLLVPIAIFAGSCSEEGLNEFIEADMFPSSPNVILVDSTYGSGDDAVDIGAPWFLATFRIVNKHPTYKLIIPALRVDYSAIKNGVKVEGTSTYTAADACAIQDADDRIYYAELDPGGTIFNGDFFCDKTNALEYVYLHSLPVLNSSDPDIRNYQVKLTFEGYYVDESSTDIVKGRVQKIRYYQTR